MAHWRARRKSTHATSEPPPDSRVPRGAFPIAGKVRPILPGDHSQGGNIPAPCVWETAIATSEYFRNAGEYYMEDGNGADKLKANLEEHCEAIAWYGRVPMTGHGVSPPERGRARFFRVTSMQ